MTVTLVVMGVSGVGKSAVAAELVGRTGWTFLEGDELHPEANRAAMAAGRPLDDRHRRPWLLLVAAWIGTQESAGRSALVTCSALRRRYRDLLRAGHPSVRFVYLHAPAEVIAARLQARQGHFMPAALLGSQLGGLEPLGDDEPGVRVDAVGGVAEVAERALTASRSPPAQPPDRAG